MDNVPKSSPKIVSLDGSQVVCLANVNLLSKRLERLFVQARLKVERYRKADAAVNVWFFRDRFQFSLPSGVLGMYLPVVLFDVNRIEPLPDAQAVTIFAEELVHALMGETNELRTHRIVADLLPEYIIRYDEKADKYEFRAPSD